MGLICLVLALVSFILAAVGVKLDHVDMLPVGLALVTAAMIFGSLPPIAEWRRAP